MEQIILELRTNYLPLLIQIMKYSTAINKSYERTLDSDLYIETISESILYIFKNTETLEKVHTPVEGINKLLSKLIRITASEEEEFLGGKLKPNLLPPEGLEYYIVCKTHPIENIYPILKAFYTSIHPDITVDFKEKEQRVIINFHSYEAAYRNFALTVHAAKKNNKF